MSLPDALYPAAFLLRTVASSDDVRFKGHRILSGRDITGQRVRIEEQEQHVVVFYCAKPIRRVPCLSQNQLQPDKML